MPAVRLALRHLHPQQRLQAEARLVEQIGLAVLALGDRQLAVGEVAGASRRSVVSISYWFCSVQTEKPPLTRYLPWSPASYQPPLTSSV